MGWARTSPSQSDALGFKIISFRSIRTTILNEVGIPVSRNNSCINYSFSWIVSNLIIKIIPRAGPGWCLGSREHPSTFPTGAPSPSRGGTQEEPWAHTFRRAAVDGARLDKARAPSAGTWLGSAGLRASRAVATELDFYLQLRIDSRARQARRSMAHHIRR